MRIYFSCTLLLVTLPVLSQQQDLCVAPTTDFDLQTLAPHERIKVLADSAEFLKDKVAVFEGKVDILSESAQIQAQQARITNNGQQLFAKGGVSYQDSQLRVASDTVELDSVNETLLMDNTIYSLNGFTGQGKAKQILLSKGDGLQLKGVSFTTCPLGAEDWKIKASNITIGDGVPWGEARHTRFYIRDVPVFYLPYFAFPVTGQRQTGLLYPKISSSELTGIDYEQPYYWNLAPNYDATISPRLMSSRGLQLKTEFRYLTEQHQGEINLEYLANDRKLDSRDNRYFYRIQHQGQLNDNWQIQMDINGVSDDNYILDLGSDFYNRADTHLYKTLGSSYFSDNLDFSLRFRDFEVIGDHPSVYRTMPEAKLSYRYNTLAGLALTLDSELAYFDNQLADSPNALRWHLAPAISLPVQRQWGEFLATARMLNTYYVQDNIEGYNAQHNTPLAAEVNRTLGELKLYGELNFERPIHLFGSNGTLTLEPKAQYLYTSYEDQSDIGQYDTTRLLNDYNGLFRGIEFTGLDRISDKNQITLGVTSRFIDEKSREQFVVSLGQIFYLADNRLTAASKEDNRSALAGEFDFRFGANWFGHVDAQLSTLTDKIERSSVSVEYRRDADSLVQLSHRYVRDLSGEQIDQLGLTASWPLGKNWSWVGRWYKDINLQRTIESYTGIQYASCCWAVQIAGYRYLSNRFDDGGLQSTEQFDTGISLRFVFKGMGTTSKSNAMLDDGKFGYRQPFVLN